MQNRFSSDYKIYRRDREDTPSQKTEGGGVFVAVRNCAHLVSTRQEELETDSEIVWVKIDVRGVKSILVCGFYKPSADDRDSAQQFKESLERVQNRHMDCW